MSVSLAAEKIFQVGPLPVTNSMLLSWIVTGFLIWFAYKASRNVSLIPSKLQNFVEAIAEAIYNLIEGMASKRGKLFFPLLATFFIFIIINNWAGLLPGIGTIGFYEEHQGAEVSAPVSPEATGTVAQPGTNGRDGGETPAVTESHDSSLSSEPGKAKPVAQEVQKLDQTIEQKAVAKSQPIFVPYLRAATSDLNTTLAIAFISVIATQYFGIKKLGFKGYITHYFHSPLTGKVFVVAVGLFIGIFIGLLEVISEFVKIVSLSFRLFGNIYAGEAVLVTVSGLLAFLAPLPFMLLEVIVGFVQASVFMMLTLVFLAIITEGHGDHAEEHVSVNRP